VGGLNRRVARLGERAASMGHPDELLERELLAAAMERMRDADLDASLSLTERPFPPGTEMPEPETAEEREALERLFQHVADVRGVRGLT
jgi:hypothetical protein